MTIPPQILSQLGAIPDSEFARLAGISRQAATGLRKAAGRPAVALPAAQLAERRRERLDRDKPATAPRVGRPATYGALAALTDNQLRMSTAAVVALTGATAGGVEAARRARGIREWEGKGDRSRKVRRAPVVKPAPVKVVKPAKVQEPDAPARVVVPQAQPGATAEERAMREIRRARAANKPEAWIEERFGAWL